MVQDRLVRLVLRRRHSNDVQNRNALAEAPACMRSDKLRFGEKHRRRTNAVHCAELSDAEGGDEDSQAWTIVR